MEKRKNKENSIYMKEDWKRGKEKRDGTFFKEIAQSSNVSIS